MSVTLIVTVVTSTGDSSELLICNRYTEKFLVKCYSFLIYLQTFFFLYVFHTFICKYLSNKTVKTVISICNRMEKPMNSSIKFVNFDEKVRKLDAKFNCSRRNEFSINMRKAAIDTQ